MKVHISFEVEIVTGSDAESAYAIAEAALMDVFGSESVRGDEPRVVEEDGDAE